MPLEVAGPAVFPNDGPARRILHSEDSRARKSVRPASCRHYHYHFPSLMKGTPARLPDCQISPAHLGVRLRECLAAPSNWRPIVLQDGEQEGGIEPEHKHAGHRLKRGQQAPVARQDDIAITNCRHGHDRKIDAGIPVGEYTQPEIDSRPQGCLQDDGAVPSPSWRRP
jgi:hypothetical protein